MSNGEVLKQELAQELLPEFLTSLKNAVICCGVLSKRLAEIAEELSDVECPSSEQIKRLKDVSNNLLGCQMCVDSYTNLAERAKG